MNRFLIVFLFFLNFWLSISKGSNISVNNVELLADSSRNRQGKNYHPSISLEATSLFMQVVAGTGIAGSSGDTGPATSAQINAGIPYVDTNGNVYVPDNANFRIRKIDVSGIITHFGGSTTGSTAGSGSPMASALFFHPYAMAGDTSALYFTDLYFVWKYTFNDGVVNVIAGGSSQGFGGDGNPSAAAAVNVPSGIWLTTSSELYFADCINNRIRVIAGGIINTVAGSSTTVFSGDNGPATNAGLNHPLGVYKDTTGKLFIADTNSHRVRWVDTMGTIRTFAGTGSANAATDNAPAVSTSLFGPYDVKGDSAGVIYIAENGAFKIRKVVGGIISTLFGLGSPGFSPGVSATNSPIGAPLGIWVDTTGTVYFSDTTSFHRGIVLSNPTSQPSGSPTSQPSRRPSGQPRGDPTSQPTRQPTRRPTGQPSSRPSAQPVLVPTSQPTSQPTRQPSSLPSTQPSVQPSAQPVSVPTAQPSRQPFSLPSSQPTILPTSQPTAQPISFPSSQPTSLPSSQPSNQPTSQPSGLPSAQPSIQPISRPSSIPSVQPTSQPSSLPTRQPTSRPSNQPTSLPSTQPISHPTSQPSSQPTGLPSRQPSSQPSSQPSAKPSAQPSRKPSSQPSSVPSCQPSSRPSSQPSAVPTRQPTNRPTSQPTTKPSSQPSSLPSTQPSAAPTRQPTNRPTSQPSSKPSRQPSSRPSSQPSAVPTRQPTNRPTAQPTRQPSGQPTRRPSAQPTVIPSSLPSGAPTRQPTARPSRQPSSCPTRQPSSQPSDKPSIQPSSKPSSQPTSIPTKQPSSRPSSQPSGYPTRQPSSQPSCHPSSQPSTNPSTQPTGQPSGSPTGLPTSQPSHCPSSQPSVEPTSQPTTQPSLSPTSRPTSQPTLQPSDQPSSQPSAVPSTLPSSQPSETPTSWPSGRPTVQPTRQPSSVPSSEPSRQPTAVPSSVPTTVPSSVPSSQPSHQPTAIPSILPSAQPTDFPSSVPTRSPSTSPTGRPTNQPSNQPTSVPSTQPFSLPTRQPTVVPSSQPSTNPTRIPSSNPSRGPSSQPTRVPTVQPTGLPSTCPTSQPSERPSSLPSTRPSSFPSNVPSVQPTSLPSQQPISCPSSMPTGQPSTIPTAQPFAYPTAAPVASIYQTNGVLFLLGTTDHSSANDVESNSLFLGSSYILFGRNYKQQKRFPFTLALSVRSSREFVSEVNNHDGGIRSDFTTRSTTIIGDVNGDGFLDLLVGYPLASKCSIYLGENLENDFSSVIATSGESFAVVGDPYQGGGFLGWSSIRLGDLNDDGFDEIVVSAIHANILYVIYGKSQFHNNINIDQLTVTEGFKITGSKDTINFGLGLTLVHHFTKNGGLDIAITAEYAQGGQSIVYVLFADAIFQKTRLNDVKIDSITNNSSACYVIKTSYLSFAGFSIAGIGDINDDGINDLAIGSLPFTNRGFKEQKTFIIYGKDEITSGNNELVLDQLTEEAGFIITGGGFLVSGVGDVNEDGVNDVMIVRYDDWLGKGNAYLFTVPSNVTYSPTLQPTASPSTLFPTSFPSVGFNISLNTTSGISKKSIKPSQFPSLKPTPTVTESPSKVVFIQGTAVPTLNHPSILPTTSHPTILRGGGRNRPSFIPTIMPSINSTDYYEISCPREGDYQARRNINNKFIITANNGSVVLTGNDEGEAKNLYVFYCPIGWERVNVVIKNFRLSTDVLSVAHLFEGTGFTYSSMNDIAFSRRSGPLTLLFCEDYSLQVILSSQESFALKESNFLFTIPRTDSSKLDREGSDLKKVQISVVFVVLAFLLCIFWSMSYVQKQEEKERQKAAKKYEEELLLVSSFQGGSTVNGKSQESQKQYHCYYDEEQGMNYPSSPAASISSASSSESDAGLDSFIIANSFPLREQSSRRFENENDDNSDNDSDDYNISELSDESDEDSDKKDNDYYDEGMQIQLNNEETQNIGHSSELNFSICGQNSFHSEFYEQPLQPITEEVDQSTSSHNSLASHDFILSVAPSETVTNLSDPGNPVGHDCNSDSFSISSENSSSQNHFSESDEEDYNNGNDSDASTLSSLQSGYSDMD
jgi:Na+-transporting methylmalonyl-CoA/oxaloacetate decarboxylase gamma subunit